MTPDRWRKVQEVFAAATEREPESRAAYLEEACRDDPELKTEVESLLSSLGAAASGFLESPAIEGVPALSPTERAGPRAVGKGMRLGPYEILSPLGAGGMGEVYRAKDERLGREVAIKVLSTELSQDASRVKRFEKEARSASALNHPNIVTVYDVGSSNGLSYIAMEKVDGETLRKLVAGGPVPVKKLLAIATQIADGLARAHEAGIVHRDLKPENVMVTKDGLVKILDFGLAKLTSTGSGSDEGSMLPTVSGTTPGVIMGTVGYMSPEQASGATVDFRSDQFSFGSILYEMVTGKRAFSGKTPIDVLGAILNDEPPPIGAVNPHVPTQLRWTIERCLAKEPRQRYSSTDDLARDLATLRDHLSEATSGVAPGTPAKRRLWLPALLGVAVLLAGLGLGIVASHRPLPQPPVYRLVSFRRGTLGNARFAPDGRTIVYGAGFEGKPMQLYSTRSDSTESTMLPLPRADLLSISASGKMAIFLGRDPRPSVLAEVSLAGGAPRELLEAEWATADWAPAGDRLAVAREHRLEFPIGTVLYDAGPGRLVHSPRFSPDGRSIAFIENMNEEDWLQVVDLGGKKRTLVGPVGIYSLAWHPGTGEIWYSGHDSSSVAASAGGLIDINAVSQSGRHRVVARGTELYKVQDITPGGEVLLKVESTPMTLMCFPPGASKGVDLTWLDNSQGADLSDDGQSLLFGEAGAGAGLLGDVYLRKTDGSLPVHLGEGAAVALSPDKKWAISMPAVPADRLVLLPTGPGQPRTVRRDGFLYYAAMWFPDGGRLLIRASASGRPPRLYVQDLAGSTPRPLTPEGVQGMRPGGFLGAAISPDGKLVTARDAQGTAFLYPVEGGEPRVLPGSRPEDSIVRFDTKGDALFLASGGLPVRIDRLDLASGHREPWKEIGLADPTGAWGLEWLRLTPDGKSYAYSFVRTLSRLYVVDGLR
jgi:serine/threonine protein kinase/Tol biopolymer transport system component